MTVLVKIPVDSFDAQYFVPTEANIILYAEQAQNGITGVDKLENIANVYEPDGLESGNTLVYDSSAGGWKAVKTIDAGTF